MAVADATPDYFADNRVLIFRQQIGDGDGEDVSTCHALAEDTVIHDFLLVAFATKERRQLAC